MVDQFLDPRRRASCLQIGRRSDVPDLHLRQPDSTQARIAITGDAHADVDILPEQVDELVRREVLDSHQWMTRRVLGDQRRDE